MSSLDHLLDMLRSLLKNLSALQRAALALESPGYEVVAASEDSLFPPSTEAEEFFAPLEPLGLLLLNLLLHAWSVGQLLFQRRCISILHQRSRTMMGEGCCSHSLSHIPASNSHGSIRQITCATMFRGARPSECHASTKEDSIAVWLIHFRPKRHML